jgi:hypothetical protein
VKRGVVAPACAAVAIALIASTFVTSCAKQNVDVGTNDPISTTSSTSDAEVFPAGYGCANWVDEDLTMLRGTTCTGACSDGLGTHYALVSQEELEAATAGQWLYCTRTTLGPADAVGLEFAPGCRIYFLVRDAQNEIIRGTTAAYQADFDIYDLNDPKAPRRIDLNLTTTNKITFDVSVSACPNRLQLRATDGSLVDLSSDFGDAGRGAPIVH